MTHGGGRLTSKKIVVISLDQVLDLLESRNSL